VEFSFKGETYDPALVVDLDAVMNAHGHIPDLHPSIARANDIDSYSYLYEVLEAHSITYANATGLAAGFLNDGYFDAAGFERRWLEEQKLIALRPIAQRHLAIDDLERHPDLMGALLAAYEAGHASRQQTAGDTEE